VHEVELGTIAPSVAVKVTVTTSSAAYIVPAAGTCATFISITPVQLSAVVAELV
jgi:hypothetical protein